ncbi:N-acetyltransferase [Pseudorhizobium endolithicum]|uniref:N-acetyltransferase n=1 Tax=Pseudorhizobium endolithicum TaxID=1191678 RepID=A0ABM8PWE1_9HYPH|nr:N-acetyltransferase [Pseudorhizobium endolithicum]CAD6426773.1 N-acetyltransferase [Rhizobium sp. Q54]CAD7052082.1 N-acetyltransferase [Pseudorhizobium endolithicum]
MLEEYLQQWKPYFEIVPVKSGDCREISDLHGQRFPRQWSDGEFLSLLLQPNVFGFLARQTNAFFSRPVGGFVLAREMAGEAEILTIAVAERFGRAGLGWRLMQAALREAEQRGAEEMFLEVEAANEPAVRLYRKLGFRTVAERPAYYESSDGERSTALVMKCDLR